MKCLKCGRSNKTIVHPETATHECFCGEEITIPRRNSLVRFSSEASNNFPQNVLSNEKVFLFLGEIPNMENHCAIATKGGKVIFGIHMDNFEEIQEEEI